MTQELTKSLLPILQAWADGKDLQLRYKKSLQDWSDVKMTDPDFDRTDVEWREKPSPKRIKITLPVFLAVRGFKFE